LARRRLKKGPKPGALSTSFGYRSEQTNAYGAQYLRACYYDPFIGVFLGCVMADSPLSTGYDRQIAYDYDGLYRLTKCHLH
jgi:hypothetical protein